MQLPRLAQLAGSCAALVLTLAACESPSTTKTAPATNAAPASAAVAAPTAAPFGKTPDGTAVQLFALTNAKGVKATITNYGGILTSLLVPDKNGKMGGVVLGFDGVEGYTNDLYEKENPYFGALIGRYGKRIAKGRFTLDDKSYSLPLNNAPNSLHGGARGFNRRMWQATPGTAADGPTLTLAYQSKNSEEGYPGTLDVQVVYTLTAANSLLLRLGSATSLLPARARAHPDRAAALVVNLLNHPA